MIMQYKKFACFICHFTVLSSKTVLLLVDQQRQSLAHTQAKRDRYKTYLLQDYKYIVKYHKRQLFTAIFIFRTFPSRSMVYFVSICFIQYWYMIFYISWQSLTVKQGILKYIFYHKDLVLYLSILGMDGFRCDICMQYTNQPRLEFTRRTGNQETLFPVNGSP